MLQGCWILQSDSKMKFLFLIASGIIAVVFAEESQVLKDFAATNVEYVGNLYKEFVKEQEGNFLICPLSIQKVFALVNGGARGNTATQITSSLRLPEGQEKIRETFRLLSESLQANDKYTLSSANKIYVANSFKISDKYKSTAVDVFRSEIQNVDFTKPEQAVTEINKWVEEKTHDKIKNLLSSDVVGPNTIAVLINALYFQGKWVKTFGDSSLTLFYVNNKDSVETNFMRSISTYNYYESSQLGVKFLEVPYEGDEVSMVFVLPNDKEGLSTLEARIGEVLAAPQFSKKRVEVVLPKFKIETTAHLIPVLSGLGIKDAFTGAADFTGIGENHDGLHITEVIQKTFIEVDEKGTTAAAATALIMGRSGRRFDEEVFIANHPFIFYLQHRVNGIFFIGRHSVAAKA